MAQSSNTGLILLLGGAAAAYYAYTQGWLSSLLGSPAAAPAVSAPASLPAPVQQSVGTPAQPPTTLVIQNLGPAGPNIPQTIASLGPGLSPCTAAQIQAAETGAGIAAVYAKSAAASGVPQATIDANVAQSLAGAGVCSASGVAGLGRVAVYLPGRKRLVVLPRNYRWRANA
jgi:hypothetical protein